MQVASTNNTVVARSGDEEHNDAPPDGHRERRLIAAHSILEGAVAPRRIVLQNETICASKMFWSFCSKFL